MMQARTRHLVCHAILPTVNSIDVVRASAACTHRRSPLAVLGNRARILASWGIEPGESSLGILASSSSNPRLESSHHRTRILGIELESSSWGIKLESSPHPSPLRASGPALPPGPWRAGSQRCICCCFHGPGSRWRLARGPSGGAGTGMSPASLSWASLSDDSDPGHRAGSNGQPSGLPWAARDWTIREVAVGHVPAGDTP
jgi:hypothetical protein